MRGLTNDIHVEKVPHYKENPTTHSRYEKYSTGGTNNMAFVFTYDLLSEPTLRTNAHSFSVDQLSSQCDAANIKPYDIWDKFPTGSEISVFTKDH